MTKQSISEEALNNQKQFYDSRFQAGYMQDFSDLYESCRLLAIKDIFNQVKASGFNPGIALDYGCGEGRYIELLKYFFPETSIYGSDISDKALQLAQTKYPYGKYIPMSDEAVNFADNSFDLVISIEVLEHVRDVAKSIQEISRLLKPQGIAIISTPCANKYSFEWFQNLFAGGFQPSFDNYGRFATDEPGHLRRLNDNHLKSLFSNVGVNVYKIYHRAHLFETLSPKGRLFKRIPQACVAFSMLDWHLFKHFSNGATMIALGRKAG
jgi:2-polyprenyl-3-methyl-5-hydroxy-6-metoxy-1,4-benzoquinol methylase